MPRARITWDVDNSELTRFRNILTKIIIILDQLDKDIVDSLDIPVLQNVIPADVYFGRDKQIIEKRKDMKEKTMRERRKLYLLNYSKV